MSAIVELLVVSPHPAARRLLQLLFGQMGYLARTAGDGDEALAQMRLRPAVVLVDVREPDEDTLFLLGLLQRRHPQTPRLVLHEGQARLIVDGREDVMTFGNELGPRAFPSAQELKEAVQCLLIERQLRTLRPPLGEA